MSQDAVVGQGPGLLKREMFLDTDFTARHDEALRECGEICGKLRASWDVSVFADEKRERDSAFRTRSTVGMMLADRVIDNMVVGGPAFNSQVLAKGDTIVKVDGFEVDADNHLEMIIGSDVPGSVVKLTVAKAGTGNLVEVELHRMDSREIAERRELFELLTVIKSTAVMDLDHNQATRIDNAIQLFQRMMISAEQRERNVAQKVRAVELACQQGVSELEELIKVLPLTARKRPYTACTSSQIEKKRPSEEATNFSASQKEEALQHVLKDMVRELEATLQEQTVALQQREAALQQQEAERKQLQQVIAEQRAEIERLRSQSLSDLQRVVTEISSPKRPSISHTRGESEQEAATSAPGQREGERMGKEVNAARVALEDVSGSVNVSISTSPRNNSAPASGDREG